LSGTCKEAYFASKVLSGAILHCVEADPDKAARLQELTNRWKNESENIFEIVEQAASDKEEELTFYPDESSLEWSLFPIPGATSEWSELKVQATTRDQIFKGIEVDFLKLDVEGADYRALLGGKEVLKRCDLRILLEIAPWGDKKENHRPSAMITRSSRTTISLKRRDQQLGGGVNLRSSALFLIARI